MSIKMADNLYMAGLHYYLYALISPLPPGTPMRRQKLSSDEKGGNRAAEERLAENLLMDGAGGGLETALLLLPHR